ncbi:hypothetical protein ATKI12_5791 [Kitasatospora sp. Ki12]
MNRRKSLRAQLAAATLARWILENGTPEMWARILIEPIPHVNLGERVRAQAHHVIYRARNWSIGACRRVRWLLASSRGRKRLTERDLDRFLARHPQYAVVVEHSGG